MATRGTSTLIPTTQRTPGAPTMPTNETQTRGTTRTTWHCTLHYTTLHYTTLHNTTQHYTSRCRRRCRRCRCTTKEWKVLCCGRPRNNDPCPKQLLRILRILRMLCNTGCLGRRRSRTTTRMTLRYVPHVPLSCKYTCSRGP